MNTTAKKIYSLVSAIVMVVLSVLLLVGTFMPIFVVNMGTVNTAEAFEDGPTGMYELDEAKIGFGNMLKLVTNRKYVAVINKYQFTTQRINDIYKQIAEMEDPSQDYLVAKYEEIAELGEELDAVIDRLTEKEQEKLTDLMMDEGFMNAMYAEIGFISIFADAVDRNSGDNYKFEQNPLDIFTVIFGMIFLAGFMICVVVFAIIALVSALKRVISLAVGFKKINLRKLESLYAGKAITALMPTFLFYTLAKAMFGSRFVMGAGLWMILIVTIIISVLRAANKIMLKEKRNPKHIARVLIGLLSFIFVLCIFNNITNMDLVEAYYQSNEAHLETVYDAKFEEALAQSFLRNPGASLSSHKYSAEAAAKAHVTEILTKNAFHLIGAVLLVSIFAFVLFSLSLNRLRENNDDFKSSYSAEKCGAHYVVAVLLLLCVLFTGTLGVSTVTARDDAYLEDGGVKILWNDHRLEDSGIKEECDELREEIEEMKEEIAEAKEMLSDIDDAEERKEFSFEIEMGERYMNKLQLRLDALENNDTGLRTGTIAMLVIVIVLEILYQAAPKLTDKILPDGVKRFLAGSDDEDIDTSMGGAPAAAPAPAATPAYSAPAYSAPASSAPEYSAPAKEKSFKQEEPATPQGGASAEDDLAAQMQRMFDSQN